MDIRIINEMIEELEDSDTTYANVTDLASLYTVRDKLTQPIDGITKELNDILPAYTVYKHIKRDYQLGKADKSRVINQMKSVCKEISELMCTIYNNSDLEEERKLILETLKNLKCRY